MSSDTGAFGMDRQRWKKLGQLYDGKGIPGFTHAAVPIALVEGESLRIFFSSRDGEGRSLPFFMEYNLHTNSITHIQQRPLLDPGELGTFDDSGVMPTCLVENGQDLYMYYIGWNLGKTVPFRNSIGLAISHDAGHRFARAFPGPVLDRSMTEPHFNASCCVMVEDGIWRMWYLNCLRWTQVGSEMRHYYHIKYAESLDGINWKREGRVAIDFKYENEYAISVPRVIFENGKYKMWYSYRGGRIAESYRIGYSESDDGIHWIRRDELVELDVSRDGWDSDMICYPFIFDMHGTRYMLYNGNGYGRTGFGLAVLESSTNNNRWDGNYGNASTF